MSVPNIITVDNKTYYSADELKLFDPLFFTRCGASVRGIVKKMNIPEIEYLYVGHIKGDNPPISKVSVLKAKLILSEEWVVAHLPKINTTLSYKYDLLPPLLQLEDSEKFMDDEGNIYNVETRGERHEEKIYFKVKDVAKIFEMENFAKVTIFNKERGYVTPIHYKTFVIENLTKDEVINNRNNGSLETYLTYEGLLKVIYTSRGNNISQKFRKWATKVVYTSHLGTSEQRQELVKTIVKGATHESIRDVLGCSTTSTPCIYLFNLGCVKDLKNSDIFKGLLNGYPSKDIIFKFGKSIDLKRRSGEHKRNFAPLKIKLVKYGYIDPQHLSRAEYKLKKYIGNELECDFLKVEVNHQTTNEIVVLSTSQVKLLFNKYIELTDRYSGCLTDLNKVNINLQRELETTQLTQQLEVEKLDHLLTFNKKEVEILQLKLNLLTLKST
ncbi:hypothetical protein WIV_gp057 [Wiseana iridescent virus]|uniref:Bro-N domain-containing protein n=1 Tax=Wiseana iridescent virus TaxID=68347 RepID=G0T583_IRV9|nr:hypothetical protein WIV_gp057 [Wiseana iridescent virus]ADO00400.1 hypothetical protein [Wiseana iridescent virus]